MMDAERRYAKMSQTIRIDIPPEVLAAATGAKTEATPAAELRTPVFSEDLDFGELFESVYDGALITDTVGTVLDANARALALFDLSRKEVCGKNVLHMISGADASLIGTIRDILDNEQYALVQAYCINRAGEFFPAEISVNRLKLSKQAYFCFFVRDVTIRKQAEELLQTEHNAIQNAAGGIAISSLSGTLTFANPAALRLWHALIPDDLMGRNLKELWAVPGAADKMLSIVQGGQPWIGSLEAVRLDGSVFLAQITASPNRDPDGQIQGMVFSFLDISAQKQAEEALRQAERQRVMLESLGAACHHLGQPATILLASLALLKKKSATCLHADCGELIETSLQAADTLGDLLHGLNQHSEYRTVPYLESSAVDTEDSNILKI